MDYEAKNRMEELMSEEIISPLGWTEDTGLCRRWGKSLLTWLLQEWST